MLELFVAVSIVDCLYDGVRLYLLTRLSENQRLEVFPPDPLEHILVHERARPNFSLICRVSVTNLIDVLKLLVEHLVHLVGICLEFVHLKDGVGELDGVLKARRGELVVFNHQWMDLFEVAVKEACHDAVFVLIDIVSVEASVLLD